MLHVYNEKSISSEQIHTLKNYSLAQSSLMTPKNLAVHFRQTRDLSTSPLNRLARNISLASYRHLIHYRDSRGLFEHRCHLLCRKGQQKLVEPSPSLPASAIAELVACKNF